MERQINDSTKNLIGQPYKRDEYSEKQWNERAQRKKYKDIYWWESVKASKIKDNIMYHKKEVKEEQK